MISKVRHPRKYRHRPNDPTIVALNQDTINTLVAALQEADTAGAPPTQRNAEPVPALFFEKFIKDLYKIGVNTGISDRKKMYLDATNKLYSNNIIVVNAKNA